jgi:hypothetical protein
MESQLGTANLVLALALAGCGLASDAHGVERVGQPDAAASVDGPAVTDPVTPGAGGANPDAGPGVISGPGIGVNAGGYVVNGDWHGYAWTTAIGAGTTISPADFTALATGDPLCASGTVGPLADYGGMAALGVNLNQAAVEPNPPLTVTPTADGIVVGVQNRGGSALRLQIQGPNGGADPNDRWCAPISGSGGLLPWTMFNTKCWDNTGAAYAKQPLQSAMILVPGGNQKAVPFDFCLTNLLASDAVPLDAGGATGTEGGTGSVTYTGNGSTCEQWGKITATRNNVPYLVVNNAWGGSNGTQCISVTGTSFTVTQQNGTGNIRGAPVSYPSVIYGRKDAGDISASSKLPAPISSLASVKTGISTNADGSVAGVYNASYDVWFNTDASSTDSPTGAYLMVWTYLPATAHPAGSLTASVTIGGAAYNVWSGGTGGNGRPYIAYVTQGAKPDLTFELLDFVKDAISRGVIQKSWVMTNVQAGFEIWSGGANLQMRDFWIDVK